MFQFCSKQSPSPGSQPGWSDIVVWQQVTDGTHTATIEELDGITDGQLIFASVLVSICYVAAFFISLLLL